MTVGLLLRVKLLLVTRSFLRRGRWGAWGGLIGIAVIMSPLWLGFSLSAHRLVASRGPEGLAAVLAALHAGWLFSSLALSGFAEGFDWRLLLRFPIRPSRIFVANVILAPLDLVALFLLPPVFAAVAAAARFGPGAALGSALAGLLILLVTGALLQLLLAALGRFLRREWTKALGGLAVGLVCTLPIFAANRQLAVSGKLSATALLESSAAPAAAVARLLPTTAFPLLVADGLWTTNLPRVLVGLLGTLTLLLLLIQVGTRFAVATARRGETAHPGAQASQPRRWRSLTRALGTILPRLPFSPLSRLLLRLPRLPRLPPDLAVLVGRDLRYFLRTPQIILGLFLTPVLVLFFYALGPMPSLGRFALPFFCLVSALNLSANLFGLDREGVRLVLLLPVTARRLLVSKNLACGTVVLATTALAVLVAALAGGGLSFGLGIGVLATFAALPLLLSLGNFLSVRHPWRMTFKVGGAPPGALASAVAQFAVVTGVAVLLAIPPALSLLFPPGLRSWLELGGTLLLALISWSLWVALLGPAARHLEARKEHLLATLAYPHETG